jgi:hypothetical protein
MKKGLILMLFVLTFGWSTSNSSPAKTESFHSRIPTTQEAQELLSVICKRPKGTTTEFNLQESTCSPCPYDLQLDMNGNFVVKLKIETVLYGQFLSAKETNAIVDTSMCEAYDNNFGGAIILRWTGSKNWEFVRYEPGNRSNDCLKFRAKAGHDLRVCGLKLQNVGLQKIQRYASFDGTLAKSKSEFPVVENAESRGDALVNVVSNLEDCDNPKVDDFQAIRSERKDLNRDGRSDFQLQISERHGQRIKTGDCEEKIQWGKTKTLTLEFLFDGTQFKATPATKPLVKYLNSFKSQ